MSLLFPDFYFEKRTRKKEGFCAIGCCCTKRFLWNKHFPRFVAFKPDLYRIWTYSQDLNPKNPHLAFLNTLQVNLMAKLPNTMLVFIALEADLALWWRTSWINSWLLPTKCWLCDIHVKTTINHLKSHQALIELNIEVATFRDLLLSVGSPRWFSSKITQCIIFSTWTSNICTLAETFDNWDKLECTL